MKLKKIFSWALAGLFILSPGLATSKNGTGDSGPSNGIVQLPL